MKKHLNVILTVLLAASLLLNLYLGYSLNNAEKYVQAKSFDGKYSAQVLKSVDYNSIQITAAEGNVTDKSLYGKIEYCSEKKYRDLHIVWSKSGYDLFVISDGVTCIHFDKQREQWGDYSCDPNQEDGAHLYGNEIAGIYVVPKEDVPDEVLNYYSD